MAWRVYVLDAAAAKTLAAAESLCDTTVDCGGITYQYVNEERAPLYNNV